MNSISRPLQALKTSPAKVKTAKEINELEKRQNKQNKQKAYLPDSFVVEAGHPVVELLEEKG